MDVVDGGGVLCGISADKRGWVEGGEWRWVKFRSNGAGAVPSCLVMICLLCRRLKKHNKMKHEPTNHVSLRISINFGARAMGKK